MLGAGSTRLSNSTRFDTWRYLASLAFAPETML